MRLYLPHKHSQSAIGPKMPIPGPVSVQVTVPIVGIAFVPRTAKGAVVPRFGATCAHAGAQLKIKAANPTPASKPRRRLIVL